MENLIKSIKDFAANMKDSGDLLLSPFRQFKEKPAVNAGGFNVMSMNDCLRKGRALPELVVYYPNIVLQGDLSIIFGQSGIGKTIFAMMVAGEISRKGIRVLYVDFEMTLRQLVLRYKTEDFPPTFFRAEMDRDNPVDDILKGIEEVTLSNYAEVVFIDNITAFGQSLDKGADAGMLMEALNALKKKYGWTLVVLSHVPKMYSGAVPLSLSAIQGSAKLNQLVDDAIGIARSSRDNSLIYVKQCKWRNGELLLDADNVALYERGRDVNGNLCFTFRGYGQEREHLRYEDSNTQDLLKTRVRKLSEDGRKQQNIAMELGISQSKVSRILNSP